MSQGLCVGTTKDVPHHRRVVPRGREQETTARVKGEGGNGSLMTSEDIQQLARTKRPDVDIERICRTSSHDVAGSTR